MSKPVCKHIPMGRTARELHFPFPVSIIGFIHNSPPVELVRSHFPEYIEITIRLRAYGKTGGAPEFAVQKLGGNVYRNAYPHVLVKIPGMDYEYKNFAERDVFYFCYDAGLLEKFRSMELLDEVLAWDIEMTPEMDFLLRRVMGNMNNSQEFGVADRIDLSCFELLGELLLQRRKKTAALDACSELVNKADSYMRFHIMEDIDMNELAERWHVSRSTFFRYWRQKMAMSPAEYFMDLKLTEACRLLRSVRKDTVARVAASLGFADPAYFCAVFKKKYGCTALEYRHGMEPLAGENRNGDSEEED